MATPTTIELDEAPSLTPMLAKAARGAIPGLGASGEGELPATTAVLRGATVDVDHLADYAEVCGYRLGPVLPPTYLHMLGFPLSVLLMTRPDFPFGLMGMVHVRNTITQSRPVGIDEARRTGVDLTATVENLRPHPKGQQLDNVVVATVDGDEVWRSISTYLKRGSGGDEQADDRSGAADIDVGDLPMTARWSVPRDIGRRYGAVSGDRNPIHLSALSAKAFGFPRAIAHGMWTKARCLAALEGVLPSTGTIDVAFKLPLLLPSRVEYATARRGDDWRFGVRGTGGKPHLAGAVVAG